MMDNISESTCENQGLTLSNSNFDKAKAHEMLIPQVLDPLTPHSSGWDQQNQSVIKDLSVYNLTFKSVFSHYNYTF